jgi:hypothetical protein
MPTTHETLESQVSRLAEFLAEQYPSNPIGAGAINTAMDILEDRLSTVVEPADFSPFVEFEAVLTQWHRDVDHKDRFPTCRHPLCAGWHVLLSRVEW